MSALSTPSFSLGPAIPQLRTIVRIPHHWKNELVSDHFSVNSNSSIHLPQDSASIVHDSAGCAALIAQETVEPGLVENGDSTVPRCRFALRGADCRTYSSLRDPEHQAGSQKFDTGLVAQPGEYPDTVTSPCEDMRPSELEDKASFFQQQVATLSLQNDMITQKKTELLLEICKLARNGTHLD